ncbi:MAG: mandelate racemase/muconate lactonizing enzyme family protein [Candidatus Hodarchaeota archaeon]
MQITEIEANWFELPVKIKIGAMPKFKITGTLLKLKINEGIEGVAAGHFVNSDEACAIFIRRWKKLILKRDPYDIEAITQDLINYTYRILIGNPIGISLVNCALWDIIGKSLGKPVHQVMGTYQRKVKAYASMPYWMKPEETVKMTQTALDERNFKAIKIRLGQGLDKDKAVIKALTDNFSPTELEVMVDVNSGYDLKTTLKLARILESHDHFKWLEEPVFSDEIDNLAELRSQVDISIAGGENNFGIHEFQTLLQKGAYDIIQPDATRSGGISIVKKIASLAEANGKLCIPHVFGTGLVQAANLQVIGSLSNCPYFEFGFYPDFILFSKDGSYKLDSDGNVKIPDGPGLSFNLDEEEISKYIK